jgi:hypothetical protein
MAYNILDLGALNQNLSVAFAITNCGQIVGWADSPVAPNTILSPIPFLWAQGIKPPFGKTARCRYFLSSVTTPMLAALTIVAASPEMAPPLQEQIPKRGVTLADD